MPCTCCGIDRTDTGLFATGPSIGKEGGGGGGGIASSLAVHKQNSFRLKAFNFMVLSIAGKSMSGSPSPNLMQDKRHDREILNVQKECIIKMSYKYFV